MTSILIACCECIIFCIIVSTYLIENVTIQNSENHTKIGLSVQRFYPQSETSQTQSGYVVQKR